MTVSFLQNKKSPNVYIHFGDKNNDLGYTDKNIRQNCIFFHPDFTAEADFTVGTGISPVQSSVTDEKRTFFHQKDSPPVWNYTNPRR